MHLEILPSCTAMAARDALLSVPSKRQSPVVGDHNYVRQCQRLGRNNTMLSISQDKYMDAKAHLKLSIQSPDLVLIVAVATTQDICLPLDIFRTCVFAAGSKPPVCWGHRSGEGSTWCMTRCCRSRMLA